MADYLTHDTSLTSIANAIRAKGGTSTPLNYPNDFVSAINNIGGSVESKQINFIDYDGSIVESYTKTEWQSVSALPSNPSHIGLTAQGWNWTKAQIDAQLLSRPDSILYIGQMYVTTSGDTTIDILLNTSNRLSPWLACAVDGTITIDWGDGSTSTVSGTSLTSQVNTNHNYSSVGAYTITIKVVSGTWQPYCASNYTMLNGNASTANANSAYSVCIQSIRLGSIADIGQNAFYNCYSLKSIIIPYGVTSLGEQCFYGSSVTLPIVPTGVTAIESSAFRYCYSMTSISLPNSVNTIGEYAFAFCYTLESITIPSGVSDLSANLFYTDYGLQSLTIPDGVTKINASALSSVRVQSLTMPNTLTEISASVFSNSHLQVITVPSSVTTIGNQAFSNCYRTAEYHFLSTTVPTLGTSAFSNIVAGTVIYVPNAKLNNYKTATNWSIYASYMVGE